MKVYGAYMDYKMFFTGRSLYLQNHNDYEVLPDHYKEVPYENEEGKGMGDLFKSTDEYQPGMCCYRWCCGMLYVMDSIGSVYWRLDENN